MTSKSEFFSRLQRTCQTWPNRASSAKTKHHSRPHWPKILFSGWSPRKKYTIFRHWLSQSKKRPKHGPNMTSTTRVHCAFNKTSLTGVLGMWALLSDVRSTSAQHRPNIIIAHQVSQWVCYVPAGSSNFPFGLGLWGAPFWPIFGAPFWG